MLPDYITNDKYLSKLPTKDQLLNKDAEKEIVINMLHTIWSIIAKAYREGFERASVSVGFLEENFNYKPHEHENIIVEFFTEKGYTVSISDNVFVFSYE